MSEALPKEIMEINDIQQAFAGICYKKLLIDGYFDMSMYIYGKLNKNDIYAKLVMIKSKYADLYQVDFPNLEDALFTWNDKVKTDYESYVVLQEIEEKAIINWVYRVLPSEKICEDFTKDILRGIKELNNIQHDIKIINGIVYNSHKIELRMCSSISEINNIISEIDIEGNIFFRGHSDPNYMLQPSIQRSASLVNNEHKMYHEILINCPDEFDNCHSHIEKLVKMQHYGLPTRLLDITRNVLVAAYFACRSKITGYGEIVLIQEKEANIKYPQSDVVTILASLPNFSKIQKDNYKRYAKDGGLDKEAFNKKVHKLVNEIRLEKPGFVAEIEKKDVLDSCIVFTLKNNNRIIRQDGAFILCGLNDEAGFLEKFKYTKNGKKVIIIIDNKEKIKKELENFSINYSTLFPEIECVAEYLKGKYDK